MDQIKIGALLKDLRKERNLTQEQIADKFGVSQRSVSRWENGNTMPDISILIELADFYDVDLREILKGERKAENMDPDLKETLVLVTDYTNEEKKKIARSLINKTWVTIGLLLLLGVVYMFHLENIGFLKDTVYMCVIIGITYQFMNLFEFLQLTGKLSKRVQGRIIFLSIMIFLTLVWVFLILKDFV